MISKNRTSSDFTSFEYRGGSCGQVIVCWFAFLLILLFMVSGCKSAKPVIVPEKEVTTEKVVETVHDTVYKTEKDSSAYRALLDCQNGKVVVRQVKQATAGKHLNAPVVSIADNQLNVDCEARAQELYAKWKSTYIEKNKATQTPVYIDKPLKWHQRLLIWLGWFLLFLLGSLIAYGTSKLIKKFKP